LFFQRASSDLETLPSRTIPINIQLQTDEVIVTGGGSTLGPEMEQETCSNLQEYIVQTAKARSEKIMLLAEEQEIKRILGNSTRIEVASDGGLDPSTGISTYGWVIAFNQTLVAKGRGPAEAHPKLAESF
jgi:hypothetical protein